MGYKFRDYLDALFVLYGGSKGEKVLKDKADGVRKQLSGETKEVRKAIANGSSHAVTAAVVKRCRIDYLNRWYPAAVQQVAAILNISLQYAGYLVSEHCVEKTRI